MMWPKKEHCAYIFIRFRCKRTHYLGFFQKKSVLIRFFFIIHDAVKKKLPIFEA